MQGRERVAPFAGAWIEILKYPKNVHQCRVAPFAGAWIEIPTMDNITKIIESLPSRERGLKYKINPLR